MKKLVFTVVLTVVALLATPGIRFFGNAWLLITANSYTIPKESSIFFFNCTSISAGSGERCEYGFDKIAFYGPCISDKSAHNSECSVDFIRISRDQAAQCKTFSPHNVKLWCLK